MGSETLKGVSKVNLHQVSTSQRFQLNTIGQLQVQLFWFLKGGKLPDFISSETKYDVFPTHGVNKLKLFVVETKHKPFVSVLHTLYFDFPLKYSIL